MISYQPLWETMKRKQFTTYKLLRDYNFSRGTLENKKKGRAITTTTLNDICKILDCRVEEVLVYLPEHEE